VAIEVEGTSQVEEFLGILRRRAWWIVIPTIVLGAIGIAVAVIVPKKFVASAQVLVRDVTGLVKESNAGAVSRMEGYVAPHVIRSRERVAQALHELGWPEYIEMSEEEKSEYRAAIIDDLVIQLVSVQNNTGAQIVVARFSHTNPGRAHDFLSKIIVSWRTEVEGRFKASERTRLETLESTENDLTTELTRVSQELEMKRRANKIRPQIVVPGRPNSSLLGSTEFDLLDQVNEAIAADDEALAKLAARIENWRKQFDAAPRTIARVQSNSATEGIAEDIARKVSEKEELEFAIETNGWTVNSSKYKTAQREIAAIVEALEKLRGVGATGTPTVEVEEVNPARVELARQMDEARAEVAMLEAQRARNVLKREQLTETTNVLYKEHEAIDLLQAQFDNLKKYLEEVGTQRALQESQVATIESDAGKFFEDLETPRVPLRPTTPNPYLIAAFFLIVGVSLGFGVAILSELSRTTFRNARDLSRIMVVPVLGTVNQIVTRRERSRHFFTHVTLATVTLAVVSVVGYVTWAWVYDPDALSEPVLSAIHGLREPFL
jgi:capsular polysaccharide biosynthesis protein